MQLLILLLTSVLPTQELNNTWTVTVNGQTVQVSADGSFNIANISAPDNFGPDGPGSPPDGLSDNFMRLVGTRTVDGVTEYVFSQPFQIQQGQTYIIPELIFTSTPPPQPVSLSIAAPTLLLTIGETSQLTVTGDLADGTQPDLTNRTEWTVYRTSNPAIATVGQNGLVTANGIGAVFITATNEGAVAVKRFLVSSVNSQTTIEGFVQLDDGSPVDSATVRTNLGDETTSDGTGFFSMTIDLPENQAVSLTASSTTLGLSGISGSLSLVPNGLTDAGIIKLLLGLDTDADGLTDNVEVAIGLDPNNPDTDNNGVPDGDEDTDNDGLTNIQEVQLGTDPGNPDSDGDGILDGDEDNDGDSLSDVDEVFVYGTDPTNHDSDGDGFNDGEEVEFGSNPLNELSIPLVFRLAIGGSLSIENRNNPSAQTGAVIAQTISIQNLTDPGSQVGVTVGMTLSIQNQTDPSFQVGVVPGRVVSVQNLEFPVMEIERTVGGSLSVQNTAPPEAILGHTQGANVSVENQGNN